MGLVAGFLVEHFGAVSPSPFGPIERTVGLLQEITSLPVGVSRHGDSYTCRADDPHAIHDKRRVADLD